jgi:hypothetical protein
MSAWPPPAHPHGRAPVRTRWPRRIAGVLATAALLGVAIAMAAMILPDSKPDASGGLSQSTSAAATPTASAKKQAAKHNGPVLTAAQKKVRTAAVASLRAQGYEPVSLKSFDPRHALRVLIAHRTGDTAGPRRAFFFRSTGLAGTDSPTPSSGLKVAGSGTDWVTLSYGVYAAGDTPASPSGGRVKVRFAWTGAALAPVGGTIPPSQQRVAPG